MKPAPLLVFFAQLPLHASLPMLQITKTGSSSGHLTEGLQHGAILDNGLSASAKLDSGTVGMTPQPFARNPEVASSTDASRNLDNELRHPTSAVTSQPEKEANPSLGEIGKPSTHPQGTSYWGALTNSWDHVKSYLPSGRTSNVLHLDTADANELEIYLNRIGTKLSVQDKQVLDRFYSAFSVSNKQFNTRVHATAEDLELLSKWKDTNAVTHGVFRNFFTQRLPEGEFLRRESVLNLQQAKLRIIAGWSKEVESISADSGRSAGEVAAWGDLLGGKVFPSQLQSPKSMKEIVAAIESFEKDTDAVAKAPLEHWKAYLGPEEFDSRLQIMKTMSNLKNPDRIPADTIRDWIEQGLDVNRMLKIADYPLEHGFPDLASMGSTELKTAKKLFLRKNTYGIDWSKSLEHQELSKTPQGKEYLEFRQNLKDLVFPPGRPSTVPSPEFEGSPLTPIIQNQRSFTEPAAVLDRPASYPGYSARTSLVKPLKQKLMRIFNVNTEGSRALSSPRRQPSIVPLPQSQTSSNGITQIPESPTELIRSKTA
ncbi:hypothetical protein Pst134EA_001083 [Puccinia striiformis f. sp. tritici]|uniref:Uncharacterized protein n=1 Tax=Puccinia striiformis f. sp. tritici PST-78 TaxID=1165861 RepID=A0A0L0VM87_9BASI|nr:hypothetical protein Pst134EA_001083 [Puccinia striiformis f. sp. tritici]KAH9474032.1 hypothetical protein Pst134EA_001083 [Puccinia striiformis f. sp. tritici]KNF00332.1 hypothetical protein PSTG_06505 [Puccinia striiformis f. sp. tritici PST-78]